MTTNITQAGDVNFKEITLINAAGIGVDISNMVINIDLFESVLNPFMTGSVLMTDSANFFSTFPIIGEERLNLIFETPDTGYQIRKQFFVDKLEMRMADNNTSTYILHFTSIFVLKDLNMKHSTAYSGYGHTITQKLFDKVNQAYPQTDLGIYTEQSANKLKFISNFWSPFKCITYCANHSISSQQSREPTFLFYEDNKKFNFRTMTDMVDMSIPSATGRTFYYDAINGRGDAATGTQQSLMNVYETILNLRFVNGFDYIGRHEIGAIQKRVIEFDLLRKAINTRLYDYVIEYKGSKHVGNFPASSNQLIYNRINSTVEHTNLWTHAHDGMGYDYRGDVLCRRRGMLANLDYMSLELEIHGRTDLVVGDVIDLRLQNFSSIIHGVTQEDDKLDALWSGHYMITEMQHRLSVNRHKIIMRVSKDGVNKALTFQEQEQ